MARILVVDDDKLVRTSIGTTLVDGGHHVVTGEDGRAAIAALRREPVDLVVLDILMPDREGIETLREIRTNWPHVPVLMISGGDQSGWSDALMLAEAFGA